MKKVLLLGGKPIGSCEIVESLKSNGYYTVVADYLEIDKSPAKRLADDSWNVSTADVSILKEKCLEEGIDAVLTGVHEFNIRRKIELCDSLNFPQYCTQAQWDFCENKSRFKEMCLRHGISVAKTYDVNDNIDYPVIVKPVDSSGSRGFSICNNKEELLAGVDHALSFSTSKHVLIEEYIQCEACIIHYTAINGEIIFSGMSDKHSQKLNGGSYVMALQTFPSESIQRYLDNVNEKAIKMFKTLGVQNGPIWIEVFNDVKKNRFIFNEMGYRFGGSMTNYPVKHFYGIDQIQLMIDNALGKVSNYNKNEIYVPKTQKYCILPIHIKEGKIKEIRGLEESRNVCGVEAVVQVHYEGDVIQNWGTAQQVFCYLHVSYNEEYELAEAVKMVKNHLSILDENGNEMVFYLLDLKTIGVM